MASSVDDRVVSMQFDNKSFEQKIAQTTASLGRLKSALSFDGVKNGFGSLSEAAGKFNLGGMGNQIEGISKRFLGLTAVGLSAINNLTNRAVNAGITFVKSFTIDPIKEGFGNYETKINAIQTILANTGLEGKKGMDQVTASLSDLQKYANLTVYNFADMAKNIGTFTAAGVKLDVATGAIKGIANLAAMSGSSADQASGAMYQLSQAIAAGNVKLQDWNSVVNAGIGGRAFQQALFNTGVALKTIKGVTVGETFDEWTKKGNTFRGSLKDGWVTSKVLTQTLKGFTGDLSAAQLKAMGYTEAQTKAIMKQGKVAFESATQIKTYTQLKQALKEEVGGAFGQLFETLFGNINQAKTLFSAIHTAVENFLTGPILKLNKFLHGWEAFGGRAHLLDGLHNAIQAIARVIEPVKRAFDTIFPPMTVKTLLEMTNKFDWFTAKLKISTPEMRKIQMIFIDVFSVLKVGIGYVEAFGHSIAKMIEKFVGLHTGGGKITDTILKFTDKIAKLVEPTMKLTNGMMKLGSNADKLTGAFKRANGIGADGITKPLEKFGAAFKKVNDFKIEPVTKTIEKFTGAFKRANDMGLKGPKAAQDGGQRSWFEGLLDTLKGMEGRLGIDKLFKALTGPGGGSSLGTKLGKAAGDAWKEFKKALSSSFSQQGYNNIFDGVNVGLLGGFLLVLRKFTRDGLKLDFGGGIVKKLRESVEGLTKVFDGMQKRLKADTIMQIAKAIAVVVASLVVLSLVKSENLTKALAGMAAGFGQLAATMYTMSKISSGLKGSVSLAVLGATMIQMSTGILILSFAIAKFGSMDPKTMIRGTLGVAGALAVLVVAMNALDVKNAFAAGVGMKSIATALTIMYIAVKKFGELSWKVLAKGMLAIAGVLEILVLQMNALKGSGLVSGGISMIAVSVALNILYRAFKLFGNLSWKEIGKGMVSIAGALTILAVATNLMTGALAGAAAVLVVSIALGKLVKAMKAFGDLSWKEIGKGMVALAGSLALLFIGCTLMSEALPGAAAILVISIGLTALAKVLKTLGSLSWGDLLKGLAGLAGIFLVLGLAAVVLAGTLPVLISLGIAMGLLGIGFLSFGAGAYLAAEAIIMLTHASKASIDMFDALTNQFAKSLPKLAKGIAKAIVSFADEIAKNAPHLMKAGDKLINNFLTSMMHIIPRMAKVGNLLVLTMLKGIKDLAPKIIATGLFVLINFLNAIDKHIVLITTIAVDIVMKFLHTLEKHTRELSRGGLNVLIGFLKGISDNIKLVVYAVAILILRFIKAVDDSLAAIIAAGANLIIHLIVGIGNSLTHIINAGVTVVEHFLAGLAQNIIKLVNAGFQFVDQVLVGIRKAIDDPNNAAKIADDMRLLAGAIINGLTGGMAKDGVEKIKAAVKTLTDAVPGWARKFLGINSPARVMIPIGASIVEGVAVGIGGNHKSVHSAVDKLSDSVATHMSKALAKIPTMLESMDAFNPVIKPVLDLSNIQNGAKQIGGLFADSSVTAQTSLAQAHVISTTTQAQAQAQTVVTPVTPVIQEIKFEQTNNSPKALSASEIYRNTRSQLQLAKQELKTP